MKFTVRFAHLEETSLHVGSIVKRGDVIGVMGNTGSEKTGIHLHLDVTEGHNAFRYSLMEMMAGNPRASELQAKLFIDDELFGCAPIITTRYLDPNYKKVFNKDHPAFDVVPFDRHETRDHFAIHWNRSMSGEVIRLDKGDPGYGTCAYVCFDTEAKND